ncbi:MAG: ATP-binding cassette domain-containing protein [Deltaproteobacteria bacterium]|nr:ATP-binding cassette domain-containing protein [Deltaproteobacteria bacterium]
MAAFTFLWWLFSYLRLYRALSIVLFVGLLLEMGLSSGIPLSFKFLIDNAIVPRNEHMLFLISGLLGGAVILVSLTSLGCDYLYARLCAAIVKGLRQQMFSHLQRLSMSFYARVEAGNLLARFSTDLSAVEHTLASAGPRALLPAFDVILSTTLLFILDWRLALLVLPVFPLSLIGPRVFTPRAATANYERKQHEAHLLSVIQENIGAQAVVKVFGLEQRTLNSFARRLENLAKISVQVEFLDALVERSSDIAVMTLYVLVIGVGVFMTFNNTLSLGSLVAFQTLFLSLTWSLASLMAFVPRLVQAAAGMQRIEELLAETSEIVDVPDAVALPRLTKKIAFENVYFSYTGKEPDLREVNFSIRRGESVAFVGPSGSGKSTILNLLTRFYDPTAGRITIDGRDLRGVTQESLRAQLGLVFQESFLFNTTIRENLRMANPGATDADVEAAARAAEIHPFIVNLPQGYDTLVGERGGRLSGGQRQRMAIARALLRDPPMLLLDEATSALDVETETAINATIERVTRGRTVVAVTHRLAAVKHADKIFVLDHGRLVEQGGHDELLAYGGLYAQLWQKQTGFVVSEDGSRAEINAPRLRAIPLLATLDEASLEEISRLFVSERFPAQRTIFQEGDPSDKFYIIVQGRVEMTTPDSIGQEQILAVLQDGDSFGENALLSDIPRAVTVRTRTPSLILSLRRERLVRLMNTVPQLRDALEQDIANSMHGTGGG